MWRGNRGDNSLLLIAKLLIELCIARNIARNIVKFNIAAI